MSRNEKFALLAGIIGFAADLLALGIFTTAWIEGSGEIETQIPVSPSVRAIVAFTSIYSWLIICWFLVRRSYLLFSERNSTVQWHSWQSRRFAHSRAFLQYVIGSVLTVAVLLSPIAFLLLKSWYSGSVTTWGGYVATTLILEGVVGLVICLTMILAMPVVYADLEVDLFTVLKMLNPLS